MRYLHLFPERIGQTIQTKWANWRNERLLKEYYHLLNGNTVPASAARDILPNLLVALVPAFLLSWWSASLVLGIITWFLFLGGLAYWQARKRKKANLRLEKACYEKLAWREYQKRLVQTAHESVLRTLRREIIAQFRLSELSLKNGVLEGEWQGKKLAIAYLEAHNGLVSGREVLATVRKCYHEGNRLIRIFSNGEYKEGADRLNQLFNLDLRLYNGRRLAYLLKNTAFFPAVSEIKDIIDREKRSQPRKKALDKRELWGKKRFFGYLFYSVVLLFMAWLRIGLVPLNLLAGITLLAFAFIVVLKNYFLPMKNEEEENDEAYFAQNGL